jgi:hypothetical protein
MRGFSSCRHADIAEPRGPPGNPIRRSLREIPQFRGDFRSSLRSAEAAVQFGLAAGMPYSGLAVAGPADNVLI